MRGDGENYFKNIILTYISQVKMIINTDMNPSASLMMMMMMAWDDNGFALALQNKTTWLKCKWRYLGKFVVHMGSFPSMGFVKNTQDLTLIKRHSFVNKF